MGRAKGGQGQEGKPASCRLIMGATGTEDEGQSWNSPKQPPPNGFRPPVAVAPATLDIRSFFLPLLLLFLSTGPGAANVAIHAFSAKPWPGPDSPPWARPSTSASGAAVSFLSRRSADGVGEIGDAAAEAAAAMLYTKPDECPARDEAAAASAGRTCQRKCETDTDCLNDRKLCLCDGVHCGMSCIRPEKECQELPDPPHGQVHLTGRQGRPVMYITHAVSPATHPLSGILTTALYTLATTVTRLWVWSKSSATRTVLGPAHNRHASRRPPTRSQGITAGSLRIFRTQSTMAQANR